MKNPEALKKIRALQALRRSYADLIIATGVFSDDEEWTHIASNLAEPKAKKTHEALAGMLGTEYVPNPDRPDETIAKSDLLCQLYMEYLEAGFLLGLAVGMRLGPNAFSGVGTGGAR